MKTKLRAAFHCLKCNNSNFIVSYKNGKRVARSFSQLYIDICRLIDHLAEEKPAGANLVVGILGSTSYEWMLVDLACLFGGYRSIALPEGQTRQHLTELIKEQAVSIVFVDVKLRDLIESVQVQKCFWGGIGQDNFLTGLKIHYRDSKADKILDTYSVGFTSGTSGMPKALLLRLPPDRAKLPTVRRHLETLKVWWSSYRHGIWNRKGNKLIVFMPFSHRQQRDFVKVALMRRVDIVLSDPSNCILHLIKERPNIMIGVPLIYDALAKLILKRIDSLDLQRTFSWKVYQKLQINTFNTRSIFKRMYERIFFSKLHAIYGGRPDFFVTGSAPITKDTLTIFYRIGVRVLEAYGQSEVGIIAMNSHRHFRFGSVGKTLIPVKISDEQEILVKFNSARHNIEELVVDSAGYIHTGDLGYLDKHGYLWILGRKDEMIVLSNGKKVFPGIIEASFNGRFGVARAVVLPVKRGDLGIVLFEDVKEPLNRSRALEYIAEINTGLSAESRIKSFVVTKEAINGEKGLFTSNLKPRRNEIKKHFKTEEFLLAI